MNGGMHWALGMVVSALGRMVARPSLKLLVEKNTQAQAALGPEGTVAQGGLGRRPNFFFALRKHDQA